MITNKKYLLFLFLIHCVVQIRDTLYIHFYVSQRLIAE